MNFIIAILAMVKAPRRGSCDRWKIRRLADLRLNAVKAALAEVGAVRMLLLVIFILRTMVYRSTSS